MTDYRQEAERVSKILWSDDIAEGRLRENDVIAAALRAAYRAGVKAMRDAIVDYWDVRDNSAVEAIADRLLETE